MKFHALWISAIMLGLAGCGQQQEPEAQQADTPETAEPIEAAPPAVKVDQAFIDHMHAHAEQLDELMFALADEDLEGAMTPAYWLSRHEMIPELPAEWQQHVVGMRKAALEVGAASDLDSARAAAEEISDNCQACHKAAGVIGSE